MREDKATGGAPVKNGRRKNQMNKIREDSGVTSIP